VTPEKLGGAVAIVLVLAPCLARADDTHYQDYPVGGRSVGLGGAFTAIADDPSGIYFNPAGIVDTNRTSVQIATTLYGIQLANSFFSNLKSVNDLEKVFTDLSIIPSSGSFVSTLGDAGPDGRPQAAYGFGAFLPSDRELNVQNLSVLPDGMSAVGCDQLGYQRTLQDRNFRFGGAYGMRIDEIWRFGVSAFLDYRYLRDHEQTTCLSSRAASGTAAFGTAQTDLSMFVGSILLAVGFKADISTNWAFGLQLSSPGIRIFDGADVRVTRGSADPSTNQSSFIVREVSNLNANSKIAPEIRGGVSYVIPMLFTFVADATIHAPVHYTLFEIPPDQRDVRDAITLVDEVSRKTVVNLNTGIEALVAKPFSISTGLFTNFSSAPNIVGDTFNTPQLPHINAWGGSFVLGFFSEHTLTRVGATFSYGSGTDVVPRYAGLSALGASAQYVRVDLNQLFVFFFLSSTFRY
jgi:long-chain fatty acid transport protein